MDPKQIQFNYSERTFFGSDYSERTFLQGPIIQNAHSSGFHYSEICMVHGSVQNDGPGHEKAPWNFRGPYSLTVFVCLAQN